MTRDEFNQNITTWQALLQLCYDYDCDVCEDIYDDDRRDDFVNERMRDRVMDRTDWEDILNWLYDIPTGGDYYIINEDDEFSVADDDDFDSYKDDVYDWMSDNDCFDEDEEEEEDEWWADEEDVSEVPAPPQTQAEEPLEDEDFTLGELFNLCNSQLQNIECSKPDTEYDDLCDPEELWGAIPF